MASGDHRAWVRAWLTGPYGAGGAGHGLVAEFRRRRVFGQAAGLGRGARGAGHSQLAPAGEGRARRAVMAVLARPAPAWWPWSARLVAVSDERPEPGREPPGMDEVDEMPVTRPLLDLGIG